MASTTLPEELCQQLFDSSYAELDTSHVMALDRDMRILSITIPDRTTMFPCALTDVESTGTHSIALDKSVLRAH